MHIMFSAGGMWDFYTMRGGIDPRDNRVAPRVVEVVDVWKDF